MDEYRQSCVAKGLLPRRWIERAFEKLPKNLKSVAFNFKAPDGESDLTEAEYFILLQTLFQEQNSTIEKANQGNRRGPLLNSSFARKTNFAIPSSLDPMRTLENRRDNVLPLESLELHGANVTHAVLKELCYCSIHASHECRLRSLVINGADLDCEGSDPLLWLSMSGPLRRTLRELTVKDCKNLKVVDPCTWALFFGTVPLESLSIHNSGFDCNDISYLCQVLCANEIPSLNLKRLDLRVGKHKLSIERSRTWYSESHFVHIKRCLSKLTELENLKLDCLNTDQKLQLHEEWKAIKGSNQCFFHSDELSTFLHLAIDLHSEEVEGMKEVVRFEQCSIITQSDSSIDETPTWKAHTPVNFPNVSDHREIQYRSRISRQRKPILTSSKMPSNPSQSVIVKEQSHQSILDKLWSRYKPPRTKPIRPYNPPQRCSVQQSSSPSRQTKVQNRSLNNARDSHKAKGKRQRSRSRRGKGSPPKSKHSSVMHQSASFSNEETSASSEEYDLEEELRFGPPPGGRTVVMRSREGTPDLMGYTHDGFIRPDDEMVYTTSASEGEIERDLNVLQKRCEIVMSTSDSTLEDASDQESLGAPSPTSLADHSTQPLFVQLPDQNSRGQNLRDPIDELQKELMELQPFYYDKQREKFKPGKIFSDSAPAGAESSGVTLRSGKRVGLETLSTEVPHRDVTDFSDRFEMASGSDLTSCNGRRLDKSTLAATNGRDVSRVKDVTSAMDRDLNLPCPRDSKDRKRQSREALRLQPWSWDPKYEKCPPNYQMYMTSKKKRRGRKTSTKNKQDQRHGGC